MNLFDGLQDAAHNIVSATMGYPASWTPSAGGPAHTATVLFNKPTQRAEISDQEYEDIATKMEYLEGDFAGLEDSVNDNGTEFVTVAGIEYACYKVERKFDGKTIIISLQTRE